jgi:hypothetical protein
MLQRRPIADPKALDVATGTILRAAAEAFPRARQRRRFIAAISRAADHLTDANNVLHLVDANPHSDAAARAAAGNALRSALGELPATLDHSPVSRLIAAGVRPLRKPSSGAEAVLGSASPAEARRRLTRTLSALDGLREQLLDLAQDITAQLDRIDGDPDLEPETLEPNLAGFIGATSADLEDAEADGADDEPWLAAPEGAQSYANFVTGARDDREASID